MNNSHQTPALQCIASANAVHQPDLWETINSIVIPREVKLGGQGDHRRPRAKVKWEGLNMFGLMDGAWRPAAYHIAFREKLILKDAEQHDAPVWRKGMSLDFTSYSPLIRGWSADPNSIRDSKGRLVCRMRRPPTDWTHNPRSEYLTYEGLVMLDHNNMPIKDFPGAPNTLKGTEEPWIIEGLRRTLGMTYWDIIARMPPVRNTAKGKMRVQTYSHFTNRVGKWITEVNQEAGREIMVPWQKRKPKAINKTGDDGSSQQVEEDEEQEEELALPTLAVKEPVNCSYPSSSRLPASTMPEQTWEGNHLNIPTFPGAIQLSQTTNTVASDSIYSAGYPSDFAQQNLYDTAAYPSAFQPQNIYTAAAYPSAFQPQNIYTAAAYPSAFQPQNIYTAPAYSSNLSSQNIYTTLAHPYHLANPNVYSSPNDHNTPISTAPGFGNIPTYTNSVAMVPQNLYTQPAHIYEARDNDFGLHRPSPPTVYDQNPPAATSQGTQPIAAASSTPVPPAENANIASLSTREDPFMGADWSAEAAEDWL